MIDATVLDARAFAPGTGDSTTPRTRAILFDIENDLNGKLYYLLIWFDNPVQSCFYDLCSRLRLITC